MTATSVYQVGETPYIRLKALTRNGDGSLVTSLGIGESIAYVARDTAGTTFANGSASGGQVTHIGSATWRAKLPAVPLGKSQVRWTAIVDGGIAIWDDYLIARA